jgi:hypothetical protein
MNKGGIYQISANTADRPCLLTEEMNVTNTAATLPFTGLASGDVGSVILKFKKSAVAAADDAHIVRMTQVITDTPTASHGMWWGHGDVVEITNNTNVLGIKLIATEALTHIATIEYYGK